MGGSSSGSGLVIPIALPLHSIAIDVRGPTQSLAVPSNVRAMLGAALAGGRNSGNEEPEGSTGTSGPACVPSLAAMMRSALLAADGWTLVTLNYSELPWVASRSERTGQVRVVLDESPAGCEALVRLLMTRLPINLLSPPSRQKKGE